MRETRPQPRPIGNPDAAKRVGAPVKIAKEFVMADIGRKLAPPKPAKPAGRRSK